MASSDDQINKPQRGHPKRAELPDVNITAARKALILRELINWVGRSFTAKSAVHEHAPAHWWR